MRHLSLVSVAVVATLLAACGTGSTEMTDASPSATSTEEHEGEGRDPAALFGGDVCTALLPALDGDTDGLDRYADQVVLDALSDRAGTSTSDSAEVHVDGDAAGTCTITTGDTSIELELLGDGHVGERAVGSTRRSSSDSAGGEPGTGDPAIASAVTAYRGSEDACEGEAADLPEGMPDHIVLSLEGSTIVAVVCDTYAYQSAYELLAWDGSQLLAIDVEQWYPGRGLDISPVVIGSLDIEGDRITNLEKGRGPGDCGQYSLWYSTGDALLLSSVRYRECEDDAAYVEPENWEQVYPSGD